MAIKIGVLGAGKVGLAIASLLDITRFVEHIVLADVRPRDCLGGFRKARFQKLDVNSEQDLAAFVRECDAVISAAPFYLNKAVAQTCARFERSYFDLTEDVETADFVRSLAAGSRATFMPQCGLAPGAINIIASGLASSFKVVRSVEMRVGALPLSASNQMKYYLSWSTAGLINEYCHCGEALYQGRRIPTLPLDGVEHLTIDGVEYEAFNTSGGVATMCETFAGRVGELNYKTLRYPGHRDLMKFLLNDLNLGQKQELLTQIFDQEVPLTFSDVVVMYVNSVGNEEGGLIQRSFVKKIYAGTVSGRPLSALQLSTAAGLVAVLELFARSLLPSGFVKQESIALDQFFDTQWGGRVYREAETVAPRMSLQA
ncbi:MAG: saccharopine dehydrogenase NADP-binding domain-containing protein [Verrucomicrobia bacterium]|nr:saccharopine dehydrogenase NADP-binding domain-containing protein [Verrucomicrobiota bacterium]